MTKRKIIALIIWWCEGTKSRLDKRWVNSKELMCAIEVTNTNWKLIKIFKDFLLEDLNVPIEKMHAQIQIHEGDNQFQIEKFWSTMIGIPRNQFNKTIVRPKGNKPGKSRGTFKLRVYNKKLYLELEKMLEKELKYFNRSVAQLA